MAYFVVMLTEADEVEHLVRAPTAGRAALAAQFEAERDVVEHGQVREEAVGLEDHAHVALVGRYPRDVAATDLDAPGGRVVQAGEDPQHRRLAATRRPEQGDQLTGGHLEVEAVQGPEGAEVAGEVVQGDRPARAVVLSRAVHAGLYHEDLPPLVRRSLLKSPMPRSSS